MESPNLLKKLVAAAALAAFVVVLGGCSTAESEKTTAKSEPKAAKTPEKAATPPAPATEPAQTEEAPAAQPATGTAKTAEKPQGPVPPKVLPLVDNMADLVRADFCAPVWIDKKNKQLVLEGETCKAGYPLEFFATFKSRGYESVLVVDSDTKPSLVHRALLALGAKAGHPVRFDPKFEPATGTEIAIELRWKDKDGKVQKAPAQQWVRDIKTKKALDTNWVFAGSQFRGNPETKKEYYVGDDGSLISVSNVPWATLDLPIHSANAMDARGYEGFVEHMPPEKTPVTIILTPKLEKADEGREAELGNWLNKVPNADKGAPEAEPGKLPADDTEKTEKNEEGK